MWAQLPWLQVGVKQASPTLIMDIVSMKLASNALILLVGLDIDFTINFLNRCRVNAINGVQVCRLYFHHLLTYLNYVSIFPSKTDHSSQILPALLSPIYYFHDNIVQS